jgi:Leucine-rich repeat (LRR) protein
MNSRFCRTWYFVVFFIGQHSKSKFNSALFFHLRKRTPRYLRGADGRLLVFGFIVFSFFRTTRRGHNNNSNTTMSNINNTDNNSNSSDDEGEKTETLPLPLQWTQLGRAPAAASVEEQAATAAAAATATNRAGSTVTLLPRPPAATTAPADQIRYPLDVAEDLWDDAVAYNEICLVGTAGQKITHIGNDFSTSREAQAARQTLKKLIFRSQLITNMGEKSLQGFEALELLELYDNQIPALVLPPNIGKTLLVLDMSFNVIRDMAPIAACPLLREVYLANNKIFKMAGLEPLVHLQKLDLGANRIREIPEEQLVGCKDSLTELWLGKNKITKIQGLQHLQCLRRLDVQSNRLTAIENISTLASTLQELYLASNGITDQGITGDDGDAAASIEGGFMDSPVFAVLTVLDLSRNQLGSGSGGITLGGGGGGGDCGVEDDGDDDDTITASSSSLSVIAGKCPVLEELWLSGNQLATWSQVAPALQTWQSSLETIYLEYNPLQTSTTSSSAAATTATAGTTMPVQLSSKNLGMKQINPDHSVYRQRLLQLIPSLTQIDANPVTATERAAAATGSMGGAGSEAAAAAATSATSSPQHEAARLLQERAIQRARKETEKAMQSNKT